jgi:hypothetical protein
MNRKENEIKKDIAKRLGWTNETLWDTLSEERKNQVISKYYNLSDISQIGIYGVLENYWSFRRGLGLIVIGLLFGVFGNIIFGRIDKYLPSGVIMDMILIVISIWIVIFCIYSLEKTAAKQLGNERILEYLLKEVEKNDAVTQDRP